MYSAEHYNSFLGLPQTITSSITFAFTAIVNVTNLYLKDMTTTSNILVRSTRDTMNFEGPRKKYVKLRNSIHRTIKGFLTEKLAFFGYLLRRIVLKIASFCFDIPENNEKSIRLLSAAFFDFSPLLIDRLDRFLNPRGGCSWSENYR